MSSLLCGMIKEPILTVRTYLIPRLMFDIIGNAPLVAAEST
jgi:hypothetical protein